jgi:hypothetical protein
VRRQQPVLPLLVVLVVLVAQALQHTPVVLSDKTVIRELLMDLVALFMEQEPLPQLDLLDKTDQAAAQEEAAHQEPRIRVVRVAPEQSVASEVVHMPEALRELMPELFHRLIQQQA